MHQTFTATPPAARVLTLNEVASILRISRGSAYEAARRGEIPTIRFGRRLVVPADVLEKMLSGDYKPDRAQLADRRGAHRATSSRRVSPPATARGKVCSRQLRKVIS
jgi:excisionase family DNA binding protein